MARYDAGGAGGGGGPGGKVAVDIADTTSNFLASKLVGGPGVGLTVLNPGGVEQLQINLLTAFDITSFNINSSLVLVGATVTPTFTATYNQAATALNLTDTDGNNNVVALPGAAFADAHSFTKNVFGQSVTYTLHGSAAFGADTANASLSWGQNVHFGSIVDPGVYNNAFITALAATLKLTPNGTYAYNASALQSCFFCTRTAFGLTTANFTVGGFPFASSRVATGVAVTNANGIVENYDVFRSDNIGLGAFNLVEA